MLLIRTMRKRSLIDMGQEFFRTDHGIWRLFARIGDLIILTILTIVCSLPVITLGSALSALYYVTFHLVEGYHEHVCRDFLHSFRQNLVQGMGLSVIMIGMGAMVAFDVWFMRQFMAVSEGILLYVGWVICLLLGFLWLLLMMYLFPLQARFYNRVSTTIWNALVIGFSRLPISIVMLICDGIQIGFLVLCFRYIPEIVIVPLLTCMPVSACIHVLLLKEFLGVEPGKADRPVSNEL